MTPPDSDASPPHAVAGAVPTVSNPIRFSVSDIEYRNAPPLHGEHTQQVLERVLGYNDSDIRALREAGVL